MREDDDPVEFVDDLTDLLGVHDVLAALAETVATSPPETMRGDLLTAISERPRSAAPPAPASELYARQVEAMASLLAELIDEDWSAPAMPYAWTVHGLLAHLAVIEEYTLRQFGLGDRAPVPAGASGTSLHLEYGAEEIGEMIAGEPSATVLRWRTAAQHVVDHGRGPSFDPAAPVPLHDWPFDAATALVVRSFEIWTHADDIRAATGRPLAAPPPADLRTMSSTSVGGLPSLLALTGGPSIRPTRVVLTGLGGGTFDLGHIADGSAAIENVLVADVVDYCRLAARRIEPVDLAGHREGDDELLDALLRAASAIAV